VRRALRGEEPWLDVSVGSFAAELAMALRPHFFALSSIAALAGASAVSRVFSTRVAVAAVIAGLGWGVGQLVNDLLDRETDRINAPDRAVVAGRLPAGPTLLVAAALGVALVVATALLHPRAFVLAIVAAVLIVFYNGAKRWPLLGNVALGTLMTVVAAIGATAAQEEASSLGEVLAGAWKNALLVAGIAAWYLQANYEKDRPGDRAAGYMTLATLIPVRASAALRAVAMVGIALGARGVLGDPISRSTMVTAAVVGLLSTVGPLRLGTDEAALYSYRVAVPASILAMLALAAPLLGRIGTIAVLVLALSLVWVAFRRSPNP
jgi:geranylgeranylglycerol-phosphate geranylgeranyltransferase